MAAAIPASVIVVSRGRPDRLCQCLLALRLQDHPAFEVIVVADPLGAEAAAATLAGQAQVIAFDHANISKARNLGLARAAAPVVAFIDDDAVAEPTWLSRLTAPFADARVVAAGGFVRGWTGLHLSYAGKAIGADAAETPLDLPHDRVSLLPQPAAGAIVTIGTNCAFRAETVRAIGGFDTAYRYFLDETDLNMRLARGGGLTAIVPDAQVLHLPGASPRRSAERMPRSLTEIGASTAVFLRRHMGGADAAQLDALRQRERRRLLHFMAPGRLAPGDVGPLMATLDAGIAEGLSRDLPALNPLPSAAGPFGALPGTGPRESAILSGWLWSRRKLRAEAASLAAQGRIVTLILLVPGTLPHRLRFTGGGWWEQTGGLSGPVPGEPKRVHLCSFAARTGLESRRIEACRSTMLQ